MLTHHVNISEQHKGKRFKVCSPGIRNKQPQNGKVFFLRLQDTAYFP